MMLPQKRFNGSLTSLLLLPIPLQIWSADEHKSDGRHMATQPSMSISMDRKVLTLYVAITRTSKSENFSGITSRSMFRPLRMSWLRSLQHFGIRHNLETGSAIFPPTRRSNLHRCITNAYPEDSLTICLAQYPHRLLYVLLLYTLLYPFEIAQIAYCMAIEQGKQI